MVSLEKMNKRTLGDFFKEECYRALFLRFISVHEEDYLNCIRPGLHEKVRKVLRWFRELCRQEAEGNTPAHGQISC